MVCLLMMACERGNKKIVQSLLQHNANVDYQDKSTGDTPLMLTSRKGYKEIVQLLLEWGANADNVHKAIGVAIRHGHSDITTVLTSHTIPSSGEYQQLVPPSSDGQSSQSSMDGHCNTSDDKHSSISYLTYGDILHTTASDTQHGRQSIGRRSIRSGGSTHSGGSNKSR